MGEVRVPGRKPLSYRRERLLDMVAISGGSTRPTPDTVVRITRGGNAAETRLDRIQSGGPDDIELQSQDRVELLGRPLTFTAFGAAGKVSEVPFNGDRVSLAEGLARIGGPLDQQADPAGVFVFRAGDRPTVYRLNLKDPRSYFVAQRFALRDKDLIFVANAKSNTWQKFIAILNSAASPVANAKYIGF